MNEIYIIYSSLEYNLYKIQRCQLYGHEKLSEKEKRVIGLMKWVTKLPSEEQSSILEKSIRDLDKLYQDHLNQTSYNGFYLQDADKEIRMKNAEQVELNKALDQHDLISALGIAGTGKTFVAMCKGLHDVEQKKK